MTAMSMAHVPADTVSATSDRPQRMSAVDTVHDHASFEPMAVARIIVASVAAALLWFGPASARSAIDAAGLAALVFAGWPIFREAVENVLVRRMTMELSMTIAIVAAAAISEFFTALVVTFFVLAAEELEHLTVSRGRGALRDLVEFIPRTARVRRAGEVVDIAVDDLRLGDRIVVSPGDKIPVDGVVAAGHSSVDQSRITGESMPAEKSAGSGVFAGSINQVGVLDVEVRGVGPDTTFGQIIQAVEAAERSRAPVQKIADRLAGYLVYFSFAAAALTYTLTRDVRDTISVIIVAGACGVAAGTPLAILGGIGRSAKLGAIVKGGIHLEALGKVDTIVFDKTGTLTFGEPAVAAIRTADGVGAEEVLRLAAGAESHSEHPLARAVVGEAERLGIAVSEPSRFAYTLGLGIDADVEGRRVLVGNRKLLAEHGIEAPPALESAVGSDILIAADGRYLGQIVVADTIRPEARGAMADLAGLGIRTVLLTGDTQAVGRAVAAEVGIVEFEAGMLPQDKLARIEALVRAGRVVAMVGDGVNDAPALSAASLGIAMGSGTDVAKESADVVLIGNDLGKLVETLRIARRTRRIIWQNFGGTIGVDAIGIALAAAGFLNPLLAAFIHVGSELAFLLNSARLLPAPDRPWRFGRRG
jgi:heavy metal translocating P-type ATPase